MLVEGLAQPVDEGLVADEPAGRDVADLAFPSGVEERAVEVLVAALGVHELMRERASAFGLAETVVEDDRLLGGEPPAAAAGRSYRLPFLALTRDPRALAVIVGTHFVIDRWRLAKHVCWAKNQLAPAEWRPPHTPTGCSPDKPDWMAVWLLIFAGNTMHCLINEWALRRWA